MAPSTARLAYGDCFNLMDKALEKARGIRVRFKDYGSAIDFRLRLNNARRVDRIDNQRLYSPGEPLHGRSVYDQLIFRVKSDCYLYMEKSDAIEFEVEDLDGFDGSDEGDLGAAEIESQAGEEA